MRFGLRCTFQPLFEALKHKTDRHGFTVAAIESFDESVMYRSAGFNELEGHVLLLEPRSARVTDTSSGLVESLISNRESELPTLLCAV